MWIATYIGQNNNATIGNFFFKKDFANEIPDSMYNAVNLHRENNVAVFDLNWRLSGKPQLSGQEVVNVNAHSVQFDHPPGNFPLTVSTTEEALNWLAQHGTNTTSIIGRVTIPFTAGDLLGDILTVPHGLGTTDIIASIYDENGNKVIASYKVVDRSTLTIDFSGFSVTGIWKIFLMG